MVTYICTCNCSCSGKTSSTVRYSIFSMRLYNALQYKVDSATQRVVDLGGVNGAVGYLKCEVGPQVAQLCAADVEHRVAGMHVQQEPDQVGGGGDERHIDPHTQRAPHVQYVCGHSQGGAGNLLQQTARTAS